MTKEINPTRRQIEAACAQIRKTWSTQREMTRRANPPRSIKEPYKLMIDVNL